jgi:hypothetical protein
MTNTTLSHHHLKAEWLNDQNGQAILLTQQGYYDEPHSVLVDPWQLHALCKHFGLITPDQQAAKAIATLQRRMLALRDRIDDLDHCTTHHSDHKHADLSHKLNTINMLAELAGEWCDDFQEPQAEATQPIGYDDQNQPYNAASDLSKKLGVPVEKVVAHAQAIGKPAITVIHTLQ